MEPNRKTPRCSECGMKIRSPRHDEGETHIRKKAAREAAARSKSVA